MYNCNVEKWYKFITNANGCAWAKIFVSRGYDEQDALDNLINRLEKTDNSNYLLNYEEYDNLEFPSDNCAYGGNHCLYLKHNGCFIIQELAKIFLSPEIVFKKKHK